MSGQKQISGYGLKAVQNIDGSVTISQENVEIVTVENPHSRIAAQFKTLKVNHRAGEHADSKMASIIECLMHVPEMADYL